MGASTTLKNYINGAWCASSATTHLDVINPATTDVLATVPLSSASEVDQAAQAAQAAFVSWRRTPATDRIQYLFKLKTLLEEQLEPLAQTITQECGKTLAESKGELRRAIENVEVACGIPILMQGYNSEDIAKGIDESMIRQPLGVTAVIAPFNFPSMISFWFMPYAIACGNTVILKPSERVPLTMQAIVQLLEQTGLPKGVINLVNGDKTVVDAILDHPLIRAISFVGSTPVAKYVYSRAAANGKRAQCQGGAKNPVIILPDADIDMTTRIMADSAFGCAGQRCLAASIAVTIGAAQQPFTEAIADVAQSRIVGYGLDDDVQMGPVI
ncbi:MAG TPA: aldehyde dehydrogenase family protein, partial [Thermosynechococcaceae cyanobacterium]